MQKSTTGDFMPIVRDETYQFRVSIRDPAQHEERGFGFVFVEKCQRVFSVLLQA